MPNRIKGITIEIGGDTTGLNKSLKGVNSTIKSTESQLKDVERLLKLDPKNTQLLAQKQKLLGQSVSDTKKKLESLKQANDQVSKNVKNYDAWKEKYDPIKKEIDDTSKKLADLKKKAADADQQLADGKISQKQYDTLQSNITKTEDKLKSLKTQAKEVDDEFGKPISPKQYDALQREIIDTENDLKSLEKKAALANTSVQKLTSTGQKMSSVGNSISGAGKAMAPVSAGMAAVAGVGLKVATDFEAKMSKVKAVTNSSSDDFKKLRDVAIDLGAKTAFSSGEVADGMTDMAKAGWSATQIIDGMSGVLDAAAASGEDLSSVSTIVANAISGFGLAAKDSTKVADLLTQAANTGTIDINDLGESFKYAAPVAKAMGFSIEDTTTALAAMSKSGIKASQAGTSLRTSFLNMTKPTKNQAAAMDEIGLKVTDSNGKFKKMSVILAEMRSGMQGMTQKQKAQIIATIAGKNAVAGMMSVVNMSQKDYDALSESMDNSNGVAKKTAATMQDNLKNKLEQLSGALESLAIKLSEYVIPALTNFVKKLTDVVDKFTKMPEGPQKFAIALGAITIAISPVLVAVGSLVTGIGKLSIGIAGIVAKIVAISSEAGAGASAIGGLSAALIGPIGLAVAIAGAITAFGFLNSAMENSEKMSDKTYSATKKLADAQDELTSEIQSGREERQKNVEAAKTEGAQADFYRQQLEKLMKVEHKSAEQKQMIKYYVDKLNDVVPNLSLKYDSEKDSLNKSTKAIRDNIKARKDQIIAEADEAQISATAEQRAKQEMQLAKLTEQKAKAQKEYEKAQKTANEKVAAAKQPHMFASVDDDATAAVKNAQTKKEALGMVNDEIIKARGNIKDLDGDMAWFSKDAQNHLKSMNIQTAMNSLVEQAKAAGLKIPKSVSQGITNGSYAVPKSVNGLKRLINFDKSVQKAGIDAGKIPKVISSKVESGKVSVKAAVQRTKDVIKFDDLAKKQGVTGAKITKGLRSGLLSGKTSISEASTKLKGYVEKNSKARLEGNAKASTDGYSRTISGAKKSVEKSVHTMAGGVPKQVSGIFGTAGDAMKDKLDAARKAIAKIIGKIAGFFKGLSLKIPTPSLPKLPHFSLSMGSKSILGKKISYPTGFDVNWYANGGIFNSPSIIGVGEGSGPEAVLPIEKLNVMLNSMADSIVSGVGTMVKASSGGKVGDIKVINYLYPNGPKMGEQIVKAYNTYNPRLGG